ncbi:hypothetical protein [Herbaspirillum sp. alder98]|uniref:hypothetical protein n=1 Tax=Herbaspirillum sp. alder98 TaxID=2913096 RepID=UPI001CD8E25D|nr:hypothetical protein [Herbaspirillum sp. alder98]MCA1324778.1 hypothetical protein [Herbaspirillum sp. alder98]
MRNVVFGLVIAISAVSFNAAQAKGTRANLVVRPVTMQQAFDGMIQRIQWMFSI